MADEDFKEVSPFSILKLKKASLVRSQIITTIFADYDDNDNDDDDDDDGDDTQKRRSTFKVESTTHFRVPT